MFDPGGPTDDHRSESIESIVASFHDGWRNESLYLGGFWERYQHLYPLLVLSLLIKVDIQNRFSAGERPTAARYLGLFPELTAQADRVVSLIYEEFCLLEECNVQPSASEFCDRYQRWRDSLASQLTYHREFSRAVGQKKPRVLYPSVGERFGSYDLCSILGRGGAAQVYLATEGQLGGRKVVLKISSSIGVEPSILANLDHRNIIPILTVAESPERGLRGICMPYRPGKTLEAVLDQFASDGLPRKAAPIWDLLELSKLDSELTDIGWKDFPRHGTYTEAVAWLGLAVSNALVYLHAKGIYHRDIKPANILLAHREGPLLFDFNLAHTPNAPEYAEAALDGGTLPYMAPEQLRAFLDPAVWTEVGAAADIYAFGLVLRELVTGLKPELPNPKLSLSRAIQDLLDRRHGMARSVQGVCPEIPPSLDAIITKCLAFCPGERFSSAKEVGDDLRCFLQRRPLRVASNTSWLELALNWIYRQREIASGVFLCLVLIVFLGITIQPNRHSAAQLEADESPSMPAEALAHRAPSHSPSLGFDPTTDRDLHEGMKLLKSANSADWEKARSIFQNLKKRYGWSAWPILYLAECYDILDHNGANDLIELACKKPDAEEAFQHRLREKLAEKANPIKALVTLGYFYDRRKDSDRAREYYQQAVALDPRNVGAMRGLARLEEQNGQHLLALEINQKLVKILVDRLDLRTDLKFEVRMAIVSNAFKQVDHLFRDPSRLRHHMAIRKLLDEAKVQLGIVQDEFHFNQATHPKSLITCDWNRKQGMLHRRFSELYTDQNQSQEAIEERRLAAARFEAALTIIAADSAHQPTLVEFARSIQAEQNELASASSPEKQEAK